MTIDVRDLITLLGSLGGPIAVFVAMRTAITRIETQLATVLVEVRELRTGRDVHTSSLGDIREEMAEIRARVTALEKPGTGNFQALQAESTGQHKAAR